MRGPWIGGLGDHALNQIEQREYLGFDFRDVERSIVARIGSPLEAIEGRFDPQITERSLEECADCPEPPEIGEHLGVKFYSWGPDLEGSLSMRFQPPAYDHLGRGGRIAVLDSVVFRTVETEGMRSLIETYRNRRDSLADDPDLALAAGAMDNLGAYSAQLIKDGDFSPTRMELNEDEVHFLGEYLDKYPVLDKYLVLGSGVGKDEEGFLAILVFVFDDEDLASRNVPIFEEIWGSGISFLYRSYSDGLDSGIRWTEPYPEAEVWNDGRVLIARLRPAPELPGYWHHGVVYRADSLVWHK